MLMKSTPDVTAALTVVRVIQKLVSFFLEDVMTEAQVYLTSEAANTETRLEKFILEKKSSKYCDGIFGCGPIILNFCFDLVPKSA